MLHPRCRSAGKWAGLGVATVSAALWIISGWRFVSVSWRSPSLTAWISVEAGLLEVGRINSDVGSPWSAPVVCTPLEQLHRPVRAWRWWFHVGRWTAGTFRMGTSLCIPLWAPFILGAGLASWMRWRIKPPRGFCEACGYDLAGNTSGPCPECGRSGNAPRNGGPINPS